MIKLICIDMDGTFLDDKKQISERNLRAVKLAAKKGIVITVCTGRLLASANYYADLIGTRGPIISANGALVKEGNDGKVIYRQPLGIENCRKILKIAQKYNVNTNYNSTSYIYMGRMTKYIDVYKKMNETLPEKNRINIKVISDWEDIFKKDYDNIFKCVILDDDYDKLKKVRLECEKYDELEITSSFYNNIEIMKKEVSKGKAVEMLAEYYSISRDEIMCIGDNNNDMSMIKYAKIGVAMGNGEEKVKEAAYYVTDTNNNDGVAKAIEKFVL